MGICFSCVSRKTEGTVRNVLTGEESSLPDEDIRICVVRPRRRLRRRPLSDREGPELTMKHQTTTTLTPSSSTSFGEELDAIRQRVIADLGEADATTSATS